MNFELLIIILSFLSTFITLTCLIISFINSAKIKKIKAISLNRLSTPYICIDDIEKVNFIDKGDFDNKYVFKDNKLFFELKPSMGTIKVGRDMDSDICLKDSLASLRHMEMVYNNGWFLSDMGAKNRTIINGKSINPNEYYKLNNGDVIQIGSTVVVYCSE